MLLYLFLIINHLYSLPIHGLPIVHELYTPEHLAMAIVKDHLLHKWIPSPNKRNSIKKLVDSYSTVLDAYTPLVKSTLIQREKSHSVRFPPHPRKKVIQLNRNQ